MDAKKRFHSVRLNKELCKGCTNCLMHCPTEAIRVRNGRAHILDERCIDCGECIRICDYHAKVAAIDTLEDIKRFKYRIALPAPTLYGQFRKYEPGHQRERVVGGNALHRCRNLLVAVRTDIIEFVVVCHFL